VRNPRNPRSLFGLKGALAAQQKTADAVWVERQLAAAWQDVDTQLSLADL
jgi:hypothetical protein